jgi:hypothetical protein
VSNYEPEGIKDYRNVIDNVEATAAKQKITAHFFPIPYIVIDVLRARILLELKQPFSYIKQPTMAASNTQLENNFTLIVSQLI